MPTEHTLEQGHDALVQLGAALQQQGYQFTTLTPISHQRVNARPGNERAHTLRDIFGWSRPFARETLDAPFFELLQQGGMLGEAADLWLSRVRWSSLAGHLFMHSRFPTIQQDAVFFGPDTYRFVQALQAHLLTDLRPGLRIADIGCGAGPGAIIAALERPEAEVWALDINPTALAFTAVNAELAGAANVQIAHSDLLDNVDGEFDLIIANPPYMLDIQERAYRHGGGEHGAELSLAIVDAALARLAPGGSLLLYTGVAMFDGHDPFLDAVRPRLHNSGLAWRYWEIDPDVFGEELLNPVYAEAERIAAVGLKVTR